MTLFMGCSVKCAAISFTSNRSSLLTKNGLSLSTSFMSCWLASFHSVSCHVLLKSIYEVSVTSKALLTTHHQSRTISPNPSSTTMSSAPNNTANLPKMCNYTYHHDPNCGHINSFSVDACPAFTCSLRQAEDGKPIACTEPTHKHDIVHPSNPSLCIQCEREWAERVKAGVQPVKDKRDGDEEPGLVSLEGTNSPIEVGMAITSPKDRVDARNVENRSKNKGKQPALIGLGIFSDSDAVRVDGNSSAINKVRSLDRRDSANPGKFGIIDDYWNGFSSVDLEESPGPSGHADTRKDKYSDSDYEDPEDFDLSPVSSLAKEPFHDASVDRDDTESTVDLENEDRDSQVDSLIQEMNELHEITENPLPSFRQFFRSLERYFPVFKFSSGGMKLNPEEARKSGL